MKVYGAASLFFVLQEYGHSSKRKCSLVADKRLRSGLKAQQAHSPGHRPG